MSTATDTMPKNELAQQPKPPAREMRTVEDNGPLAFMMDTARFEHLQRVARMLGCSDVTPKHLLGDSPERTMANCFRVVNQAMRWGVDPFALADESYVVHGRLGYQGKLVAAIVQRHAPLDGRLRYSHTGSGGDRTITVSGRFVGESEDRTIELSVKTAKTDNKMWTSDPDQKLVYSGVTKWARRHCPEVLLGVLTEDDLDRIAEQSPKTNRVTLLGMANKSQPTDDRRVVEPHKPISEPKPADDVTVKTVLSDIENAKSDIDINSIVERLGQIWAHGTQLTGDECKQLIEMAEARRGSLSQ